MPQQQYTNLELSQEEQSPQVCEAKWGLKACNKYATGYVISRGVFYNLCPECKKVAKLQEKANNK